MDDGRTARTGCASRVRTARAWPSRQSSGDLFPSGAGLAATWNADLLGESERQSERRPGQREWAWSGAGRQHKAEPALRSQFEYFLRRPLPRGGAAKGYIKGLQSRGVGASIKHFAANNQEKSRMIIEVVADERSLREIYLPAFEAAVRDAKPWTVMCAYNRINGTYCSENPGFSRRFSGRVGIRRGSRDRLGRPATTGWPASRRARTYEMPATGESRTRI